MNYCQNIIKSLKHFPINSSFFCLLNQTQHNIVYNSLHQTLEEKKRKHLQHATCNQQ